MRSGSRLSLCLCTWLLSAGVYAQQTAGGAANTHEYRFDIPAESLEAALNAFESQTRLHVEFYANLVRGRATRGLTGSFTAEEALRTLLGDSGLRYKFLDSQSIAILPATSEKTPSSASTGDRVAIPPQDPPETATERSKATLEEIVVTAEKRSERLQDVPVPVTALDAQTLADNNQVQLQQWYTSVPGLSMNAANIHGSPQLSIRGVTTGGEINPTVAIVVDDIPYGSSQYLGFIAPDLDPSDLARIEVLRGPQGTLYGASGIGGVLKYVTVDPSLQGFSARVQAGLSNVDNAGRLGYALRGSMNLPIGDTMALRVGGFTRQDPGYVDNVETGQHDINRTTVYGGHVALLWNPLDDLSIKLSALLQNNDAHGSPNVYIQAGLSDLQQEMLRGTGGYSSRSQVYSANLSAKIGIAELTAISGYAIDSFSDSLDETAAFGGFLPTSTQFGRDGGIGEVNRYKTDKFTQEVRLAMPLGSRIDWVLGGYYSHEHTPFDTYLYAIDQGTGAPFGTWLDLPSPLSFEEYAAFTDVTLHMTDKFDVQLGGRESHNNQTYQLTYEGPFAGLVFGSASYGYPRQRSSDNAFTYLLTPRYLVSPDLTVYARLASGYRPGGPNATPGVPSHFGPDKTTNYEVGVKGKVADLPLSFDASVYYIDWKGIQLNFETAQSLGYTGNGSRAKSEGIELSGEARPLDGLTVSAWAAWNEAVLTEAFPAQLSTVTGNPGDRLPFAPRISGNLSFEQRFPIVNDWTGFCGGAVSYVGNRIGKFQSSSVRQYYSPYTRTDLRAGAEYHSWTVNLFVDNATNRRGVLSGGLDNTPTTAYFYIEPRTTGVSFTKTF